MEQKIDKRIRILFFIENLSGGGAEKVLCNLVNEMDQSKFDITVQTLWKADAGLYLKPGIRYRYCYAKKTVPNRYRSRLEASLGLTYPFHIKDNYDIEAAYLEFGSTKILAGSTNKKAKKLAWVHCDLRQNLSEKPETIQKIANHYQAYGQIVCVSQTAKESFVQLFGREEDVAVLYNTVDDTAIREKALAVLPKLPEKRRLTVVSVGRLSREKQFDLLLRVHKRLLQEGLDHDLWIVGEGVQRSLLEKQIMEDGLTDSVQICGYQPNPYPFMQAADLLACSSRYEGLSTFVTEGLILGKPVVTTDCSGMRELLGASEYGMIVENSEEALLNGMRSMIMNPSLRTEYAAKATSRGKQFSARELTAKAEAYFINLLEE